MSLSRLLSRTSRTLLNLASRSDYLRPSSLEVARAGTDPLPAAEPGRFLIFAAFGFGGLELNCRASGDPDTPSPAGRTFLEEDYGACWSTLATTDSFPPATLVLAAVKFSMTCLRGSKVIFEVCGLFVLFSRLLNPWDSSILSSIRQSISASRRLLP